MSVISAIPVISQKLPMEMSFRIMGDRIAQGYFLVKKKNRLFSVLLQLIIFIIFMKIVIDKTEYFL